VRLVAVSVIVRARDEAGAIARCLELLAGQTRPPDEVIVVDDDSRDATAEIARRHGARVIPIAHSQFSFGRALNLGAGQAKGELLVALSAHAFPRDAGWLSRLAAALEDPAVACACGDRFMPDGAPLAGPVRYDARAAERWPEWGYSNAAGAFRAQLWRERPFREDLPACEDREWARHWAGRGYVCLIDPGLLVDHDHTHDPLAQIYRRARREARAQRMFLPGAEPPTLTTAAREWWADTRFYANPWRARLSHRRLARIAGTYAGARAHRDPPGGG
jgi:rhamnosyltransferase